MYSKLLHASSIIIISLSCMTVTYADQYAGVKPGHNQDTNKLRMLRGQSGPMSLRDNSQRPLQEKVASQFAPQFGINNPDQQLRVKKQKTENAKTHIRYGQIHRGLPVIAGELVANLNEQNQLTSMSGETSPVQLDNVTPTVSAEQASATAMQAVAKWYQLAADQLVASTPVLSVFDPSLLMNTTSSSSLVWQINVTPNTIAPINEYVLVDAQKGGILLHFNQVDTARLRETRTADNLFVLPGSLLCTEATDPCASGDADTDAAHDFAGDTYDFYFNTHGRDSINDNDGAGPNGGMMITSTVHFGPATGQADAFQNAFWLGTTPLLGATNQMVYGDGFSLADDVVAHELTHGVTSFESQLFYYSESGAINESLSDVWGEFVDQTNGAGTDTPTTAWQLGEDLPASIGVVRDMQNPGAFGDPDRMTSNNFYVGPFDNGGVHTNSGVNNKATYLMVEGSADEPAGRFNGVTIDGLSGTTLSDRIAKAAHIYYRVQTNYLTTGSDYLDLYNALNQSCTDLIGTNSIDQADCDQVQLVTDAVEMNQVPNTAYAPSADICPAGVNVYDLFVDNFESNNISNWTVSNELGGSKWSTGNVNLASNSGLYTLLTSGHDASPITTPDDPNDDSDSSLQTNTAIRVPSSTTAYIHFDHAFYFEATTITFYDGGVIEYTIDNGSTWNDASSLIDSGRTYNGALAFTNSESGRMAFTSYSNGFNSTRLNLSSLAGEFVRFRFRSLADETVESGPWTIDNFRTYLCADNAPPSPNAGADRSVSVEENVQLSATATDTDGDTLSYAWTQLSGVPVTLSGADTLTPTFTTPNSNTTLVFQLSVTGNGQTESDTVSVTVFNNPPNAFAGNDQVVQIGSLVQLTSSGTSDADNDALTFLWTQTNGTAVTLSDNTAANPTFTAPATTSTLGFLFTATDEHGLTSTDTVSIDVGTILSTSGSGCTISEGGRFDPLWLLLLMFFAGLHLKNKIRNKDRLRSKATI